MNNAPLLVIDKILGYYRQLCDVVNIDDIPEKNLTHQGFDEPFLVAEDVAKIKWDKLVNFRCLNQHWLSRFDQLIPHIAFYNKRGSDIVGVKRGEYVVIDIKNYHPSDKNISIQMIKLSDTRIYCKILYYYRQIGLIIKNIVVQNAWRNEFSEIPYHIDIENIKDEYIDKLRATADILKHINDHELNKFITPYFKLRSGQQSYYSTPFKNNFIRTKPSTNCTFIDPNGQKIENKEISKQIGTGIKRHTIINPSYAMLSNTSRYFTLKIHQFQYTIDDDKGLKEYIV